ncbi:MAG TPA: diguanylate cyclase [Candidatus Acidoferrales bacterium]|nr:diguanylate cyclase [Candidatus Acidoferrales bacterium]
MKVLVAEDETISRRLLEKCLRAWGYETLAATNGTEAWELLRSTDSPRLAILDWVMPEMEGVDICRRVRSQSEKPYTYLILLTSRSEKQNLLEGMKAGADDYLGKPFDADELLARLQVGERILKMQDELIAARDLQHHQATHDTLTGVATRRAAMDFLTRELARAARENKPVGVVIADLDHFKQINDTYGHMAGDMVLQEAAKRMSESTRAYDCVGRFGGEEFLIIFPTSNEELALRQAERIRKAIEATPVETREGRIRITASLGVATSGGTGSGEMAELLRAADRALYCAKSKGRNRVERASEAAEQQPEASPRTL